MSVRQRSRWLSIPSGFALFALAQGANSAMAGTILTGATFTPTTGANHARGQDTNFVIHDSPGRIRPPALTATMTVPWAATVPVTRRPT